MVKLKLYYRGKLAQQARYLEQTLRLLKELEPKGEAFELNDTDGWTEEQFRGLYYDAVHLAVLHKYGIRRAFGSRTDGRLGFAKYVPALFVYDDAGQPIAVYPRLEGGRRVEIPEYLVDLLKTR